MPDGPLKPHLGARSGQSVGTRCTDTRASVGAHAGRRHAHDEQLPQDRTWPVGWSTSVLSIRTPIALTSETGSVCTCSTVERVVLRSMS